MSGWDGLNRRKFPRVNFPCQIIIRQPGESDSVILTHTENVGHGGVGVIFKKNLKMFSLIEMELDLLDLDHNICCQGKVMWAVRRKNDESHKPLFYDIGVEFVDITERDRQRVEKVVAKLCRQGLQTPYR